MRLVTDFHSRPVSSIRCVIGGGGGGGGAGEADSGKEGVIGITNRNSQEIGWIQYNRTIDVQIQKQMLCFVNII